MREKSGPGRDAPWTLLRLGAAVAERSRRLITPTQAKGTSEDAPKTTYRESEDIPCTVVGLACSEGCGSRPVRTLGASEEDPSLSLGHKSANLRANISARRPGRSALALAMADNERYTLVLTLVGLSSAMV